MSVLELWPTICSLSRSDKIQLMRFIVDELAREEGSKASRPLFIPPPEDRCPYTPAELDEMLHEEGDGVTLTEIWRKLGRS